MIKMGLILTMDPFVQGEPVFKATHMNFVRIVPLLLFFVLDDPILL